MHNLEVDITNMTPLLSLFLFLTAMRKVASFAMHCHHDVMPHLRPKSKGHNWPFIEMSKTWAQINLSSFKVDYYRHLLQQWKTEYYKFFLSIKKITCWNKAILIKILYVWLSRRVKTSVYKFLDNVFYYFRKGTKKTHRKFASAGIHSLSHGFPKIQDQNDLIHHIFSCLSP
jgi:hypothetical protein